MSDMDTQGATEPRQEHWLTLSDLDANEDGPMLTIPQIAVLLQLSDDIVRDVVKAGDIRGVRLGRSYRILWVSFRNYLIKNHVLPLPAVERRAKPRLPLPLHAPQIMPAARAPASRRERRAGSARRKIRQ